jgi:hypothetical protein
MTDVRSAETVPTFAELDFIANQLYQADAAKRNGVAGARWWCIRSDLRTKWRAEARRQFLEWSQSEQFTMERMRG